MTESIDALMVQFHGNGPAPPDALRSLEKELGIALPVDYRQFMENMDGGEGFIGKQYLILWRANELLPFNRDYQVEQYAPGILLFASSGGGEAFAFDKRDAAWPIVQVPFIGLDLRYANRVANSFNELLMRMHTSHGSLL
jgi:hypothetical protein